MHGEVVKHDAEHDGDVPDVVAAADVVEGARQQLLGQAGGVDARAADVHGQALAERSVEEGGPGPAARDAELHHGREAGGAEREVKGHARPRAVVPVEARVPGQHDAADAEGRGGGEVGGAAGGLAVEGRVLGRHDAGRDQHADAGVVEAGEAGQQARVRDAAHGVPQRRAGEALGRGGEEQRREQHVGGPRAREGGRGREDDEGERGHDQQAQRVAPHVDALVGQAQEGAGHAVARRGREAVAAADERVALPRRGEVVEVDEAALARARRRRLDATAQRLAGVARALQAVVDDASRGAQALAGAAPARVDGGGGARGGGGAHRLRARLGVGQEALEQAHAGRGARLERGPRRRGHRRARGPALEDAEDDVGPPPPGVHQLARRRARAARAPHRRQRRDGPLQARVQVQLRVPLDLGEPALELVQEQVELRGGRVSMWRPGGARTRWGSGAP